MAAPRMRNPALAVKSRVEVPALVEKRRAQIVGAAIELFGRQGYHVTTMREVAQRAGVSTGLIYQYVQDKEDVLFLALVDVLQSYERELPAALVGLTDPLARLDAAVRAYCRVIDRRLDATVLAYRETHSLRRERRDLVKQMELRTNALIAACVEDGVRAGVLATVDVELLTWQLVMLCHAWALKAWHFRGRTTVDEYVDRGLALMLAPVRAGATAPKPRRPAARRSPRPAPAARR